MTNIRRSIRDVLSKIQNISNIWVHDKTQTTWGAEEPLSPIRQKKSRLKYPTFLKIAREIRDISQIRKLKLNFAFSYGSYFLNLYLEFMLMYCIIVVAWRPRQRIRNKKSFNSLEERSLFPKNIQFAYVKFIVCNISLLDNSISLHGHKILITYQCHQNMESLYLVPLPPVPASLIQSHLSPASLSALTSSPPGLRGTTVCWALSRSWGEIHYMHWSVLKRKTLILGSSGAGVGVFFLMLGTGHVRQSTLEAVTDKFLFKLSLWIFLWQECVEIKDTKATSTCIC